MSDRWCLLGLALASIHYQPHCPSLPLQAIRKAWSSSKPSRVASSDVNVQRWRVLKEMVETKVSK
jgi:hypothetical protein